MPARLPRSRARAQRLASAGAVLALLLAACSGGADGPSPGDPSPGDVGNAAATAQPSQAAASDAARDGSPPEFHGERVLAVQPARKVFVQPSCTPDTDGIRMCWTETADPLQRQGPPSAVTLTDAVMRLDDLGLEWSVRLTFADPLTGVADTAASAGDAGLILLLEPDDVVLRSLDTDAISGRVVRLAGLEKDEAWDLVEMLGDESRTPVVSLSDPSRPPQPRLSR